MRDELYLGPVPLEEECSQVGTPDYLEKSRKECRAYINQIKRKFGEPPMGAGLIVKSCPHDFGTYHEVVVVFDDLFPDSEEWAYSVDNDLPLTWDEEAKVELTFLDLSFS
jgi:hypothetical protein